MVSDFRAISMIHWPPSLKGFCSEVSIKIESAKRSAGAMILNPAHLLMPCLPPGSFWTYQTLSVLVWRTLLDLWLASRNCHPCIRLLSLSLFLLAFFGTNSCLWDIFIPSSPLSPHIDISFFLYILGIQSEIDLIHQ